jgi:AhpC/TSA antioxidant enzyme
VLVSLYGDLLEGLEVVGVVKETVDPEGLVEFATRYFPFPLYCDKTRALYRALGDRQVGIGSLLFNPLSLIGIICDTWNRITSKQIEGNQRGEGLVQGGIIVFDSRGTPFAAAEEETGVDLSVQDIIRTVQALRIHHRKLQERQPTRSAS